MTSAHTGQEGVTEPSLCEQPRWFCEGANLGGVKGLDKRESLARVVWRELDVGTCGKDANMTEKAPVDLPPSQNPGVREAPQTTPGCEWEETVSCVNPLTVP